MNNINSLILEGKLSNEVKVFETQNGLKVARAKVASSRFYKNEEGNQKEEITTVEFECYGRTADFVERKAENNISVRVVGRLKQEGEKVFIIAEHIEFRA